MSDPSVARGVVDTVVSPEIQITVSTNLLGFAWFFPLNGAGPTVGSIEHTVERAAPSIERDDNF